MRTLSILALLALPASGAVQTDKFDERLRDCGTVLQEVLDMPESIPRDLLDKAECVLVMPSVKKFALGIGGSYGAGAMVCRSGDAFGGPWGPPALYRLDGANIGFQIGGQATDFIFLVMNDKGANALLSSKVKLGADASAAAGPKGRSTGAATDASMRAEILTYSRSQGLFAGVSLEGASLRPDNDANKDVYGREISARDIVLGSQVASPAAASKLVSKLQSASPKNLSQ
ncbi:MAG TPA: lipid-binding SYLF domain-containing protein [Vicinamibacteria bacterium]|jgi:lipid-binding SYLF domain-containing protein